MTLSRFIQSPHSDTRHKAIARLYAVAQRDAHVRRRMAWELAVALQPKPKRITTIMCSEVRAA